MGRWQAVAVGVSLRTRALLARFIFDAAKVIYISLSTKHFGIKRIYMCYYLTFENKTYMFLYICSQIKPPPFSFSLLIHTHVHTHTRSHIHVRTRTRVRARVIRAAALYRANRGFWVGVLDAVALIINYLGVPFRICFTKRESVKKKNTSEIQRINYPKNNKL